MVPPVQLSFANVPYVLLVINPTSRYSMKLLKTVIFRSNWQNLSWQSWVVLKAAEYSYLLIDIILIKFESME